MADTLKALIKQVVQINESIEEATGREGTFTLEGPVHWEAVLDLSDFVRGDLRFRSDCKTQFETPEAAVRSLTANLSEERSTTNSCKDTTP